MAQLLATQGLTAERAKADQAEQTARVLVPDLIVLAGDVARDRGKAMLAKLTTESPIATLVIATPELGGLTVQVLPRHVGFLGLEGGTGECARRIRSLAELFAEEGLASCSLQQLVDTVAPRVKATTNANPMPAAAPIAAKPAAGTALPAAAKQVTPARGVPVAASGSLAEKAMAALEAHQAKARAQTHDAAPRNETLKLDAIATKPQPANDVIAAKPQPAKDAAPRKETQQYDAVAANAQPAKKPEPARAANPTAKTALPSIVRAPVAAREPTAQPRPRAAATTAATAVVDPLPITIAPVAPVISAALPVAQTQSDSAARSSSPEAEIYFSASEPAPAPSEASATASDADALITFSEPAPALRVSSPADDVFISMSDPAPAHVAPAVVSMSEPAAPATPVLHVARSEEDASPDAMTARQGPPPLKRAPRNTLQNSASPAAEAQLSSAVNGAGRPLTSIHAVLANAPAEKREPAQPKANTAAERRDPSQPRLNTAAERRDPTQQRVDVAAHAAAPEKREPTGAFKREPTGAFKREPTGAFKREPTGAFKTLRDPLAAAEAPAMQQAAQAPWLPGVAQANLPAQPAPGTLAALLAEHARAEEPPSAATPSKVWRASIYLTAIACCAAFVIVRLGGPSKSLEAAAALGSLSGTSSSSSSSNRRTPPPKPTPRTTTQPTKRPAFTAASNRFQEDEAPSLEAADAPHQPSARELASEAELLVDEGALLFEDGRLGLAEASYLKALKIVPSYPRAMSGLVRVHIERKDGVEALRWATLLVTKQPKNGQNQLLLGDAQALRGDMAAAKEAWTRATRLGNPAARQRLLP